MLAKPWLDKYDPAVPEHLEYPRVPLFVLLRETARKYPHHPCLIFNAQAYSYAQVNALSDALARALVGMGIQKGQPVGLMLPNLPQFVVAFFGILKAGGVVVAINPYYKQRELEFQIGDTALDVMIAAQSSAELLDSLKPEYQPRLRIFTTIEDAAAMNTWLRGDPQAAPPPDTGRHKLEDFIRYFASQPVTLPEVSCDDPAIYQYSGGTTGIPKAAVGLHRNLVANSLQFRAWLAGLQDGQEVFLTAIPLYHVYGMVIGQKPVADSWLLLILK